MVCDVFIYLVATDASEAKEAVVLSFCSLRLSDMGMFQRDRQVFADAEPLDDSYEPKDIRKRDEELEKYQRAL